MSNIHSRRKRKLHRIRGDSKVILRFFLLFALIMLLFGGLLRLLSSWQNRIWVGDARVTFVAATSPVTIFSYEESRELVSITFPKNVEIDGAAGAGEWKLENLYELGKTRGTGTDLLTKSLQYSLDVPIDGYFEGQFTPGFPGVLSVFVQKSNFTFFDKVKIAATLVRVTPAGHKARTAEKLGIIAKKRLGDGTLGFEFVPEKVKDIVVRELADASLVSQNLGVGIVNGTSISRAGEQIANITKAMGSQVLWVRTQEEEVGRCLLRVSALTETVDRIAKIFSCETKVENNLPAPIVFVIGRELAEELPR